MFEIHCRTAGSYRDLFGHDLELLFEGQRAVLLAGGSLCLRDDMHFVIADVTENEKIGPAGILACYPHGDDATWLQIAYVRPEFQRRGVFRRLIQHLEESIGTDKIGMGTNLKNDSMITAAKKCGFVAEVMYLWKSSEHVPL